MKSRFYITAAVALLLSANMSLYANDDIEARYQSAKSGAWELVIDEKLSDFDSSEWVYDGEKGHLTVDESGLTVTSGPEAHVNAHHSVLWNKQKLSGDLKVEYDFTRLDNSDAGSVNIIYLHAQGSGVGEYTEDIMEWNHLRTEPAMKVYFNNMKTYHISYAVTLGESDKNPYEYVRARMYNPLAESGLTGTDLKPEYYQTGLFKVGVKYHITVTLVGDMLYMEVEGDGVRRLMHFNVDASTRLEEGYLGFRLMWTRSSKFANLKVYEGR